MGGQDGKGGEEDPAGSRLSLLEKKFGTSKFAKANTRRINWRRKRRRASGWDQLETVMRRSLELRKESYEHIL